MPGADANGWIGLHAREPGNMRLVIAIAESTAWHDVCNVLISICALG